MKRGFILALALIMALACFAGCQGDTNEPKTSAVETDEKKKDKGSEFTTEPKKEYRYLRIKEQTGSKITDFFYTAEGILKRTSTYSNETLISDVVTREYVWNANRKISQEIVTQYGVYGQQQGKSIFSYEYNQYGDVTKKPPQCFRMDLSGVA